MNPLLLEVIIRNEEALLAGLGLKHLFRFSEYEPGTLNLNTFLCKIQAAFTVFSFMLRVHSTDLSSNVRAFGFRILSGKVWMTPSVGSRFFSFENVLVREVMKSYSVLGLVIRLNYS